MILTGESLSLTQEDLKAWIDWYVSQAPLKQQAGIEGMLCDFAISAPIYLKCARGEAQFVACPDCGGRGTSGIILPGDQRPRPCQKCGGGKKVLELVQ